MGMTYKISSIALCLFILAGVQVVAAGKRKLTNSTVIAKSSGPVALKAEGVRVPLELVRKNQSLSARIANLAAGKSVYVVFKNLHTSKQPGTLYNVYVNLEEGKTPTTADTSVGTLNFYNFGGSEQQKTKPDAFFSFNVTETLKKLTAAKQLTEPLILTIIPVESPAEGIVPTVGQIELIEQ